MNSLTSLPASSFLHCLTKSQTSLTSTNCISLQDFILCYLIHTLLMTQHREFYTRYVLMCFCTGYAAFPPFVVWITQVSAYKHCFLESYLGVNMVIS